MHLQICTNHVKIIGTGFEYLPQPADASVAHLKKYSFIENKLYLILHLISPLTLHLFSPPNITQVKQFILFLIS